MASMSPSNFMRKVSRGEYIPVPTDVNGFSVTNLDSKYKAYEGGTYKIDDPKYGRVGTVHLKPRVLGGNPWSLATGSGVVLAGYSSSGYKINIKISSSAKGSVIIRGKWDATTVVRDNKGDRVFDGWRGLETLLSFEIAGDVSPTPGQPDIPTPPPGSGPCPPPGSDPSPIQPSPPLPPPPPPPPPPPLPKPIKELVLRQSTVETVALGDRSGNVEWAVTTRIEPDGIGRIDGEALPRRVISDYLTAPKIFRPVVRRTIKRSVTAKDSQSIENVGEREKRVRFTGIKSWDALIKYAESSLVDAARCVKATASIPCNPLIRAGDSVLYKDFTWIVERANHSFGDWTTTLTMRRIPLGSEIKGVFSAAPGSTESAIVKVVKDAANRVNNAVEGTVLEKLDARTYLVKVQNSDERRVVRSDHVIFGDLIVGTTILIGRGTL